MSSWILISKRAGDLLMTAVLLVRFHVRRNLGLWPEGEQADRRKNTHEHGGGQQGFFRRYQMSFEPRAPGELVRDSLGFRPELD